jgi:hypothetical protein
VKLAEDVGSAATTPDTARIEATASGSMSWFFGENASIEGGMMTARSTSSPAQTYALREKTHATADSTSGRRKSHADRARSFG